MNFTIPYRRSELPALKMDSMSEDIIHYSIRFIITSVKPAIIQTRKPFRNSCLRFYTSHQNHALLSHVNSHIAAREADIIGIHFFVDDVEDRMESALADRVGWIQEVAEGRFEHLELNLFIQQV